MMENFDPRFLPLLWGLGLVSPVVASVCAALFYARHCRAYPNPERRISLIAYVLVSLVCAIVAFFIGLQYGVAWACSSPGAGNLCGLNAIFFAGPVAAALAIFFVGASTMLLRGDEKSTRVGTTWNVSSVCSKLWRGQYSFGRSFWGFFVLGTCIAWVVGILGGFMFIWYPPTLLIYRLVFLGYLIIAAVGVWRSANALARSEQHSKTFADSVKIIAAKTLVVLISSLLAVGGYVESALRHMHING
jgi:hypothetical protein